MNADKKTGGTGDEWSETCGTHCSEHGFQRFVTSKRKRHPSCRTQKKRQGSCYVCSVRSVAHTRTMLDVKCLTYVHVHFCARHVPPFALLKTMDDIYQLHVSYQTVDMRSVCVLTRFADTPVGPQEYLATV
jgi:hypothetical protein